MAIIDDIKSHYGVDKLDNTSDADKPLLSSASSLLQAKLERSLFDTVNAMPGLPVYDVGMAFLPSLSLCDIDGDGKVSRFIDSNSSIKLTQDVQSKKPELKVDALGREYLRFERTSQSHLHAHNIALSGLGGSTGKTCTFMFIANVDIAESQTAFGWIKGSPGAYNSSNRLTAHIPWVNNNIYVDFAGVNTGRLTASNVQNVTGRISAFLYEYNQGTAKLYKDGVLIRTESGKTSTIPASDTGTLQLNGMPAQNDFSAMDFYAMFIYPRVLTAEEKAKMFLYVNKYFRQVPTFRSETHA